MREEWGVEEPDPYLKDSVRSIRNIVKKRIWELFLGNHPLLEEVF
jgi:hypothetical protein